MPFLNEINRYDPQQIEAEILAKTAADVELALAAPQIRLEDFKALLSPAAADFLEPLAQRAHKLTVQRFGKTILMYAPLYLSNECSNGCRYCGFNAHNKMARRTLTFREMEAEAKVLHDRGFRHLLLVTGEAPKLADNAYLCAAVERLRPLFSSMSIEVYPMDRQGYQQVVDAGVDGLTIYQDRITSYNVCYTKLLRCRRRSSAARITFSARNSASASNSSASRRALAFNSSVTFWVVSSVSLSIASRSRISLRTLRACASSS